MRGLERALVLEDRIVHFPELALVRRRLGGLGRVLRVRVHLAEREISKDESEALAKLLLNGFHDRIRAPAMRALVVSVLDERDGRAGRTLRVVARANRQGEHGSVGFGVHGLLSSG